jgi:acyl carrier protein
MRDDLASAFGVPVIHGYGSTEAGSIAVDPLPPGEWRMGSVGIVQNLEMRILDEAGTSLPRGRSGEIVVRGPGVIRSYENDPESDRMGFVDGWWRTGDLGWMDADGYVYLTGRVNEVINRGGVKVSPAEVDEVFARHPQVREATTVGVAHPSLGEDVVTAVVLREPGSTSEQALHKFALRALPPSKAPSVVVIVDDLPRNAMGKVQRRMLAASLASAPRAEFVAPRSADERVVADVFAAALELERAGAYDHFFRLGGDSLRAMQVVARIGERTGIDLPAHAVFEAPTVEELAQRLATARAAPTALAPPAISRRAGAG